MRLRQLDLTRYGKFTDTSIDFGALQNGTPDLHIIYGPNEAGKSTAICAFLDLLFGIDPRSGYGFLHSYATMKVGACLELSTGVREVQRIKKIQNSLLDVHGRPLPDNLFAGDLGGIQRGSYETMFSLDDATLKAGGNNILASKGDLGQLLFSASAGIGDLSRNLAELRTEADAFYKPRARSGELADLKSTLATLKQEKERLDILASHYAHLVVSATMPASSTRQQTPKGRRSSRNSTGPEAAKHAAQTARAARPSDKDCLDGGSSRRPLRMGCRN